VSESEKTKVAMICAAYPPKAGPGATRMGVFARGLAELGFEPTVYTSQYSLGDLSAKWLILDNINRTSDDVHGTEKKHVGLSPLTGKLVSFFVLMEPIWTLSLLNLSRVFKRHAERGLPDLIFTTSNPMASAVGGTMLKRRFKIPLVVEFRDPWTLNPLRSWPTKVHYLIEKKMEKAVLRNADAVIMNTPRSRSRSNLLREYEWLDERKVHVVSHGFDNNLAGEGTDYEAPSLPRLPDTVRIAYAGGFYPSRQGPQNDLFAAS